ncbi:hypothetical protein ACVILE_002028 [Streptomyces sp. M18.1]
MAFHERRPAGGEPGGQLGLGPVLGEPAPLAPAQGARADVRQQRRQQCDGGRDGEDHGQRGGDGHAVEEAEPEDQHAQQGDAHGRTREDDGSPGGGDGVLGGLRDGEPPLQAAPVPGDDEQRVVDADAEADEGAQHGREVGDGHGVAEQGDAGVGGADGDQRGGDGQQGGGEGAEGEEEDDGGDGHADGFGEVALRRLGQRDGAASQLHLEPVGPGRPRGVDDGPRLRRVDVLGGVLEGHRGVRGAAVLADPRRVRVVVGVGHRGHAGEVRDAVQGAGHGLFDAGGAHGVGRRVPDDRVAVAVEAGEAGGEQPGGTVGVGAGHAVVVGVRRARDAGGRGDPAEGEEPEQDGDETTSNTPACEGCHERAPRCLFVDL